jgi:hypothetical protein
MSSLDKENASLLLVHTSVSMHVPLYERKKEREVLISLEHVLRKERKKYSQERMKEILLPCMHTVVLH